MNNLAKGIALFALALPALAFTVFTGIESGMKTGQGVFAFDPVHVTGPDRGTNTCPVCKYGAEPAAQVWINADDAKNVAQIAKTLEAAINRNGLRTFRAFMVFVPAKGETEAATRSKLAKIASANGLKSMALTYIDGNSQGAIAEYHINTDPKVKNTVMVYANRTVVANFVNLKADEAGIAKLNASVAEAVAQGH